MARKTFLLLALGAALVFCLIGCGGQSSTSAASSSSATSGSSSAVSSESSPASASSAAAKDFDGSAFSDTGNGSLFLRGPGGTNEDGSVLQIAAKKGTTLMQIDVNYQGGDGSVGTVYVDGIENMKMNAAENPYSDLLTLQKDALTQGVHTVEFVRMDGDAPAIYKKTQYEIFV